MVTVENNTRMQSNIDHIFNAKYILICRAIISNEEINEFLPPYKLHSEIMASKCKDYSCISIYTYCKGGFRTGALGAPPPPSPV